MRLTVWLILLTVPLAQGQTKKGYLPDEAAAVKRAEVVLSQVYGKKQIESERPLVATLKEDVWTVRGSLNCSDGKGEVTSMCVGGVAEVRLRRKNGHVLSVGHSK